MDHFEAFCQNLRVYARRAGHDLELYKVKLQEKYDFSRQFEFRSSRAAAMFIVAGNEAYKKLGSIGPERISFALVVTNIFIDLNEGRCNNIGTARKFYCEQFGLGDSFTYTIESFIVDQLAHKVRDYWQKTNNKIGKKICMQRR